jgi:hypothetical protein
LLTEALERFEKIYPKKLNEAKKKFEERHPNKQLKKIDEDLEVFKEILAAKDVDAWYEVKHVIVDRKNEVITNILHSKSPYFHPEMKDKGIAKAKSILLRDLKLNELSVQNSQYASLEWWDLLQSEGLYYLVAQNNQVEPIILNLYSEFDKYNRIPDKKGDQMYRNKLIAQISEAIAAVKQWEGS